MKFKHFFILFLAQPLEPCNIFQLQLNQNKMKENKNDQLSQQASDIYLTQSTQPTSDSEPDKIKIEEEEIEEYDLVTDQRRPQFRFSENYGRRNYLM